MNFIPYDTIGKYSFGDALKTVLSDLNKNFVETPDMLVSKYIEQTDGISYRFDDGKFTQLHVDLIFFKEEILLSGVDITNKTQIDSIIKTEKKIERKAHWVFQDIGLVVSKDKKEFYFFDKSLLKNWELINRPITSW